MLNKKTKRITIFIILLLTLLTVPFYCSMAVEDKNPLALDVVIVLDQSTSMRYTNKGKVNYEISNDPYGFRMDAAAIMLSMCDVEHSRAAIITFDGDVNEGTFLNHLYNIGMDGSNSNRKSIIGHLESLREKVTKDTNIGAALEKAVSILMEAPDVGNDKIILLLTDGEISFTSSDDDEDKDKEEASKEQMIQAIETAKNANIKINALALNASSKKTYDTSLLSKAASETGGMFGEVTSAQDLPENFNRIFAAQIGSDIVILNNKIKDLNDGYYGVSINVPNRSVTEVNIMIASEMYTDIALYRPGSITPVEVDNTNILMTQTEYFTTYKIVKPNSSADIGEWLLKFIPTNDNNNTFANVSINVVFSYNVNLGIELSAVSESKQNPVTVSAFYTEDNQVNQDPAMYAGIPATAYVYSETGDLLQELPMTVSEDGLSYTTSLNLYKDGYTHEGNYSISVHSEGAGLLRDSDSVPLSLVNDAPIATTAEKEELKINNPGDESSYSTPQTIQYNIPSDYVIDPNGDDLTLSLINPGSGVITGLVDGMLTVQSNGKATDTVVEVIATDIDGDSIVLSFPVAIISVDDKYDDYTAVLETATVPNKGTDMEISLTVYDGNGDAVNDSNCPETLKVDIIAQTQGNMDAVTLVKDDLGIYKGIFHTTYKEDTYNLSTFVYFGEHRKTLPLAMLSFTVINEPVQILNELSSFLPESFGVNPLVKSQQPSEPITIPIADLFYDANLEPLTGSVEILNANGDLIADDSCTAYFDDGALVINSTAKGDYTLIVTATDNDNASNSTISILHVVSLKAHFFWMVVGIVGGILLLFAICRAIAYAIKPSFAGLAIQPGINGMIQGKTRNLPNRGREAKRPVSLGTYYVRDVQVQGVTAHTLNNIILCPNRNGVKVQNKLQIGGIAVSINNTPLPAKSETVLRKGATLNIKLSSVENTDIINFTLQKAVIGRNRNEAFGNPHNNAHNDAMIF